RFRIVAENFVLIKTSATGNYFVNTNGLACGKTYDVDVRASFDNGATWCVTTPNPNTVTDPAWGDVCLLTTASCFAPGGGANMITTSDDANLTMYPNPNRGDQFTLSLDKVQAGVNKVSVDIYDTFGKRVSARTIAVNDTFLNTVIELGGELAAGMYTVSITAGEKNYVERMVIQP
ncbi:MAG TPA: T9SS type A sorting domain-containing protein, partial [Flavobacteriales bacterium]|nr:T9SS type A sorting domain-containing protein [Flavobacteriales bacterium]